jgi:hypothetical protein
VVQSKDQPEETVDDAVRDFVTAVFFFKISSSHLTSSERSSLAQVSEVTCDVLDDPLEQLPECKV